MLQYIVIVIHLYSLEKRPCDAISAFQSRYNPRIDIQCILYTFPELRVVSSELRLR